MLHDPSPIVNALWWAGVALLLLTFAISLAAGVSGLRADRRRSLRDQIAAENHANVERSYRDRIRARGKRRASSFFENP